MKALLLVVLAFIPHPVRADDAPLLLPPAVAILQGQPAPADGVFMTTEKALEVSFKCEAAKLERDGLKHHVENGPGVLVLGSTWLAVAGLVVGLVAGGAVVLAVHK